MSKKRKPLIPEQTGFKVNACSLCEGIKLTAGNQAMGGVRYCAECLTHTLGWFQMDDAGREKIRAHFAMLEAQPAVQTALAAAATITDEERKAISIGESRRRLMDSMLRGES